MNAPAASAARSAAVAVAASMDRIKAIEHEHGVTRPALDAILAEMLALAEHEALSPKPSSRRRPRAKKAPAATCCKRTPIAASPFICWR